MPTLDLGQVVGPQGPQGPQGIQGPQGKAGPQGTAGANGITPHLQVGTVTTLDPDISATVTRQADSPDAAPVFDFGIPRGHDSQNDGDMHSGTYDPTGKARDIFAYTDEKVAEYAYSKTESLSGATAALYEKPATAVPDDILKEIYYRLYYLGVQRGDCYLETGSFYTPGGFNDQVTLSTVHKPFFLFLSNSGDNKTLPLAFCLRDCSVAQISLGSSSTTSLHFTQNAATWTDNSVQFTFSSPYDAIWQYFILSKFE